MRRERDPNICGVFDGICQPLLDLRHVPVVPNAVGVDALRDLGVEEVELRRAARTGDAGLGVDDDVLVADQSGFEQRDEGELDRGGVAAGVGDEARCFYLVAGELGEAVDCFLLEFFGLVLASVPVFLFFLVLKFFEEKKVEKIEKIQLKLRKKKH